MPRQLVRASVHDRDRSLGWLAVDWIEHLVVHGPGDVQGEPVELGDEYAAFIADCYAIGAQGDDEGRMLYDSAFLSRPKGCNKSGLAGYIALFEALGPSRFAGWAEGGEVFRDPWGLGFEYTYRAGEPMGRRVQTPVIRCLATEEGQAGNVYDNIHLNLNEGPLSEVVPSRDAGLSRIILPGGGEILPSTAAGASKDGGKETFVVFDEALALDTPLPTPTGWTTMGDVRVGDRLIGSDGLPVSVVKVTDVMDDRICWRVNFSDGTSIVASDGHLWQTRVSSSAALPLVRTTGEMVRDGRRFRVPRAAALKSPDVPLPIDPYVLGLWLGDGDARNATVTASVDDVDAVAEQIRARGYTARRCETGGRAALLYISLSGSHRNRFSPVKGLKVRLREQGLLQNKHIPLAYLRAGTEQRVELLRGLMDSDGCVLANGFCVFSQTDEGLVREFVELLRSLGQDAHVTWQADSRSRQGGGYKVSFTPVRGLVPFSLPRKVARVRQGTQSADWVTVTSIEPVATVPVRCVGVDAVDHLFVAGEGWKVTHNTHLYNRPDLRSMYKVVTRNLRKRKKVAQTWFLETTTMYLPGEESVAEETYKLAELIREGKTKRERLMLDHRWGEIEPEEMADEKKLAAALTDAYGDALAWNHLPGLIDEVLNPVTDVSDSIRYFLNDKSSAENAWILDYEWRGAARVTEVIADRDVITLGFDGSRARTRGVTDATALIGCRVADGHLFEIEVWEQPRGAAGKNWEVPVGQVLAKVKETFEKYTVVGFYADPAKWESHIAGWEAEYGPKLKIKSTLQHPIQWWMTGGRSVYTVRALEKFRNAVIDQDLSHDGAGTLTKHVLAARMRSTTVGVQISKDHPDSLNKIDAAVAAVLAWQARLDAVAAGISLKRRARAPQRVR